jgi:hypothetical protein
MLEIKIRSLDLHMVFQITKEYYFLFFYGRLGL